MENTKEKREVGITFNNLTLGSVALILQGLEQLPLGTVKGLYDYIRSETEKQIQEQSTNSENQKEV